MSIGLAMGLGTAVEMVPLDATREAPPLGESYGVDSVSRLEHAHIELLSYLKIGDIVDLDFLEMAVQAAGALQMPTSRLVEALDILEAELHPVVSILVGCLYLGHHARTNLDGGDTHGPALLFEELGRAYFFPY